MENNSLIPAPEILGKLKSSWSEKDFKTAIKKFRQNAPAVPTPRLYDAYRWLKERLDAGDEQSDKQFTYFIEHFLRILEERGAAESEIYSEVLRDSAEYKYLRGLFHNDETENEKALTDKPEKKTKKMPAAQKTVFKDLLKKKKLSLLSFDAAEWRRLIEEYFKDFKAEDSFVKNCSLVLGNINRRAVKEPYHTEIIIAYAFDRLTGYKRLSLKSKDFAMQLLNMMTGRDEIWNRIHKEYLEIIKK